MKRSFILFSAIVLGLFSSCSDDDSSDTPEDALMGSWQLTAEFDDDEPSELETCDLESTIIFKSAGVYEYLDYDPAEDNENECVVDDDSFTAGWSIPSPGKMAFSYEDGENFIADYSISGNELTISFEDEWNGETWVTKSIYIKK